MGPKTQHTHSTNNLTMESPFMGLYHHAQTATASPQPHTIQKTTKNVHPTAPTETGEKKLQLFDPIKLKPALQIHSKHLKPHEHMLDMLSNHYTPTPDPSITTESSKVYYGTYQKNAFKNSTWDLKLDTHTQSAI